MATYSIFVRASDPTPLAIVDRFSWFAALLPPVYLVAHRLWLGLAGFVLAIAGLIGLSLVVGDDAASWLYVLAAIWLGFEAPALRRSEARRAGYLPVGERIAAAADLAERDWLGSLAAK